MGKIKIAIKYTLNEIDIKEKRENVVTIFF